jgi:hypothetical protein
MRTGFWAVLLVLAAGAAEAQSLADVARQEAARRAAITRPGKVYTNESLGSAATPRPAPATATPEGAPAVPAAPPSPSGASAAPQGQADGNTETPAETPAPAQDEAAWRERIAAARDGLARSQAFADALQSQINGLTTDFAARDDPAQRAQISTNRQKALAELERVKQEVVQYQKQITDIQEEARRAGVPAGWVR